MNYDKEVSDKIDEILNENTFGFSFQFNPGQREVIHAVCASFLKWKNGDSTVDSVVLSAPTGYGKSIIAMFTSKILQLMGYGGYILTVDLALQQQYETDFKRLKLNYHSIKGVSNYKCHVNSKSFKEGDCHSLNVSYEQLKKLHCYPKCAYLQARERAMRAKVSMINYAYWLIQRNKVAKKMGGKEPFPMRDFVFFDECHRLDEVVQNQFSIKIPKNFADILFLLNTLLLDNGYFMERLITKDELKKLIQILFKTDEKGILFETLNDLKAILEPYIVQEEIIKDKMKEDVKEGDRIPESWKKIFNTLSDFNDMFDKIDNYIQVTEGTSLDNIVKRLPDAIMDEEEIVEFVSLKEDFLIKKYALEQGGFKIFMSATLGSIPTFAKIIGLKKSIGINMKHRFNYDKSPILFLRKYRLDYKNKHKNIAPAVELMDHIIGKKHFDQNGIVHTASFEFANEILKRSKFRKKFITYTSKNKRTQIKKFLKSSGKILIGPSILEGLDLSDDLCRFQMFFKIPYPSLNDPLIVAKLKENQTWYDWKTSIAIIQGSNRGIRHMSDYADTYILDGCFTDLINKNIFDKSFVDRLKNMDKKDLELWKKKK